jgi:nitrogen fixation protein NifB
MGIAFAARLGLEIKINTILIPGVNEGEIEGIAKACHALGAKHMNVIPLIPVKGTALESAGAPRPELLAACRKKAEPYLAQLTHCRRCRADAAGILGEDIPASELKERSESDSSRRVAKSKSFRAAVATREGFFINQHLGEADRLYVFDIGSDGIVRTEGIRELPSGGGGLERWNEVADIVSDCAMLFVAGIGAPPRVVMEKAGIAVQVLEGLVSEALKAASAGRDLGFLARQAPSCASSCSGGASRGCGCS